MKKEKHFRILPDFMIRTAMLPLESINEIKTGEGLAIFGTLLQMLKRNCVFVIHLLH